MSHHNTVISDAQFEQMLHSTLYVYISSKTNAFFRIAEYSFSLQVLVFMNGEPLLVSKLGIPCNKPVAPTPVSCTWVVFRLRHRDSLGKHDHVM
jgi:hypothetical protein